MNNNEISPVASNAAFRFAEQGTIGRTLAATIIDTPQSERIALAESLASLSETHDEEGVRTRAGWLARQLVKEVIEEEPFLHYVADREPTSYRDKLGRRAFTNGRHSSGFTQHTSP